MASALALALPRYVAFKGDNGNYLCVREMKGRPHLLFVANDISDPTVQMEILVANNGNIHIKHTCSGKFWSLNNPNIILADVDAINSDNMNNTLFRPFKVNSKSIALMNLGNHKFCNRFPLTLMHALNAYSHLTDFFSRLKVEEPVTKREISDIKYNFDKARVYDDDETVILAEDSATNRSQGLYTVDFNPLYEDVKTTLWKTNLSLKLEAKALFDVSSFPIIVGGKKVELFDQRQRDNEMDETMITTTIMGDFYRKVVLLPRTTVMMTLIATKCKCDVPFTFMQSDTLYDGNTFETQVQGNTYTASNYCNLKFQIKQEHLKA